MAFYGGTFTRLHVDRIKELLSAVSSYLKEGLFKSIRVSTRPDALDPGCLQVMKTYGVTTVELGAQSMDNHVLSLSRRGHTAEDTVGAVERLRRSGFKVGVQLMPGLPGDDEETFRVTITKTIRLNPDMVRLYPAVVIQGTEMADMYRQGRYQPMDVGEAVQICSEACMRLEDKSIPVIRMGLMSSPSLLLKGQIVAGPWHPAFGFLVRSTVHHRRLEPTLPRSGVSSTVIVAAPQREIPLVKGFKNQGLKWIEKRIGAKVVRVEPDDSVLPGRIRVRRV